MEFDIHIQPYPYYGHMELPFGIIKANMDYERNGIFIEKDKLYISNSTAYSTYLNQYDLIDKFAIEHLHLAKAATDIDITKIFQMHYMFFSDPSENQTIMKNDLFIDVCSEKKKDSYYPILKCSRQCGSYRIQGNFGYRVAFEGFGYGGQKIGIFAKRST